MTKHLLFDKEQEVKRSVSFTVCMAAQGAIEPARDFLARHVPPENHAATWVLVRCRSEYGQTISAAIRLVIAPVQTVLTAPALGGQDRRSVESAARLLQAVRL